MPRSIECHVCKISFQTMGQKINHVKSLHQSHVKVRANGLITILHRNPTGHFICFCGGLFKSSKSLHQHLKKTCDRNGSPGASVGSLGVTSLGLPVASPDSLSSSVLWDAVWHCHWGPPRAAEGPPKGRELAVPTPIRIEENWPIKVNLRKLTNQKNSPGCH